MREKAMEGAEELEEKEEKFHFNQLLLRADIRYKNGRAKPIDTLLKRCTAFRRSTHSKAKRNSPP